MEAKCALLGFGVLSMILLTVSAGGVVEGTVKVDLGADFRFSWKIPHFYKLSTLRMFVNKTLAVLSYWTNFPDIGCVKHSEDNRIFFGKKQQRIFHICSSSMEPYSSVRSGMFNLVIRNISIFFNGSNIMVVFDYKHKLNHSSPHTHSIHIVVEKPLVQPTTHPLHSTDALHSKHFTHSTHTPHSKHTPHSTDAKHTTTNSITTNSKDPSQPSHSEADKVSIPTWAIVLLVLVAIGVVIVCVICWYRKYCRGTPNEPSTISNPQETSKHYGNKMREFVKGTLQRPVLRRLRSNTTSL